ncbi:MAG TPA: YiiX/YebB-like N1pC/P60 family cysteine hydrolase [Spirochaetota bacterium]|nr:YiiX/YebB-like N1pC/P60 family cysteine hydrolase [Spirochaetota bacterium]HPR36367.1 YiiX/YebB-like N1pC/P60 family cysteine hydrolase [Spirochaetota bacterium]HRX47476.1 YiiX/YebB-like N1pC/P60 family cysteine hydrolase [Spirochaetota bacterium]
MFKRILVILLIITAAYASDNRAFMLADLPKEELYQKQKIDMGSLTEYRRGLYLISSWLESNKGLFKDDANTSGMISAQSRDDIKSLWKSICDFFLAIDSIDSFHRDYHLLKGDYEKRSFHICRAAMLMEYSFALDFIERIERRPELAVVLNDSVPEIGLPAGTYDRFKFRFLNVLMATEFAAFEAAGAVYGKPEPPLSTKLISEDSLKIWKYGIWKGEALTAKNGMDILKRAGKKTWFPVQKGISNFAGDAKVYRINNSLITDRQIREIAGELKPGDIMLERREWYLTNIGIPGFWTHAAIYIGTPKEREEFFNSGEIYSLLMEMGAASVEDILKKSTGRYKLCLAPDSSGHVPRVIEAIGEGVLFTTIEHSASCDSIAVLRPRLSKREIALALIRAFRYSGRPYDFDFDFLTDSALVCTELVYKSYEPGKNREGLVFPLEKIMGRNILPANGIAKLFSDEVKYKRRQLDFVLFFDGIEKSKKAVRSTEKIFFASHKRPKWHVFKEQ